ncbi:MAG: DAK2 domain-containing protein [Anaerolineae bacterium]
MDRRYGGLTTNKSRDSYTKGKRENAPEDDTAGAAQVETCDGDHLLRVLRAGGAWLEKHVPSVNALNVFPVPDGDTGTNMSLTIRAALQEAGTQSYASVSELARVVAHGALMGARGNSGVILSQIMRGFARAMDNKTVMSPLDLADGLREGAATAYKGVMKPVEGTILTVVRECAEAAARAGSAGATLEEVLETAVREARASVARTPHLLPVLAQAGVVDAGGQGLLIILEGSLRFVRGEVAEPNAAVVDQAADTQAPAEGDYNYDTQFIIKGTGLDVERIREQVAAEGDSVLVVGDSETIKVHVHSDQPGRVLDIGVGHGQVTNVIIENMQLQYEEFVASQTLVVPKLPLPAAIIAPPPEPAREIGVIAVVSGDGLKRVFESLGASAVVPGGQTMNPSTQDLLSAIENCKSSRIILLPNNSNIILAANQARELASKEVVVLPTKTAPQGIAALLAYNYEADLPTNIASMLEASRHVQTGEVTRAVRSVRVNGLSIEEGQIIGLLNDDLNTVGEDVQSVALDLLDRMHADDYEIITIYYGKDVTQQEAEELAEHCGSRHPELEFEVLDGGQPHYYFIISAE